MEEGTSGGGIPARPDSSPPCLAAAGSSGRVVCSEWDVSGDGSSSFSGRADSLPRVSSVPLAALTEAHSNNNSSSAAAAPEDEASPSQQTPAYLAVMASLSSTLANTAASEHARRRAVAASPNRRAVSIDIGSAVQVVQAASRTVEAVLGPGALGPPAGQPEAAQQQAQQHQPAHPQQQHQQPQRLAALQQLDLHWLWPPCIPSGQELVEVAVHLSALPGQHGRHAPRHSAAGSPGAAEGGEPLTLQVKHLGLPLHSQEVAGAGTTLLRFKLPPGPERVGGDCTVLTVQLRAGRQLGASQQLLVMPADASHDFWGLFSDLLEDELRPAAEVAAERGLRHAPYISAVFDNSHRNGGPASCSTRSGSSHSSLGGHGGVAVGGDVISPTPAEGGSLGSDGAASDSLSTSADAGSEEGELLPPRLHGQLGGAQRAAEESVGRRRGDIPSHSSLDPCRLLVHNALLQASGRVGVEAPGSPASSIEAALSRSSTPWEEASPLLALLPGASPAGGAVGTNGRPGQRHSIDVPPSYRGLGAQGTWAKPRQMQLYGEVTGPQLERAFADAWRHMTLISMDVEYLLLAVPTAFSGRPAAWDERLYLRTMAQVLELLQSRGMWCALSRLLVHCNSNGFGVVEQSSRLLLSSDRLGPACIKDLYVLPVGRLGSGASGGSLTGTPLQQPVGALRVPVEGEWTLPAVPAAPGVTIGCARQLRMCLRSQLAAAGIAPPAARVPAAEGRLLSPRASVSLVYGWPAVKVAPSAMVGLALPFAAAGVSLVGLKPGVSKRMTMGVEQLGVRSKLEDYTSGIMMAFVVCYCLVFFPILTPSLHASGAVAEAHSVSMSWCTGLLAPAVIAHCLISDAYLLKTGWVLATHCATAATASVVAAYGLALAYWSWGA